MKTNHVIFIFICIFCLLYACKTHQKRADIDTAQWRYEIEAAGEGIQGTYQIKVWSYSKSPAVAIEQAKKNAVHGVIFKGFPSKDRIQGQRALTQSPNLENEKEDFFKGFFAEGGKYLKFVSLTHDGAIAPGDRIKINKNEYKIGVFVSVNVAALRRELENEGIIRALGSGF